jgi:hypothetical protein
MYRIIYDLKEVHSVVLESDSMTIKPADYLYTTSDSLQEARESLLSRGINCKKIEDELGIEQEELAGFHTASISSWNDYTRKADLVVMHILPVGKYFTLVYKVKHYLNGVYAGEQQPDHIEVLRADNTTLFPTPDGGTIGEFDYWSMQVHSGAVDLIAQMDYFVSQRDTEGRFNKPYATV